MKGLSWMVPYFLVLALYEAAAILNTPTDGCVMENLSLGKRGLFRKLSCIRGKDEGSGASGSRKTRKSRKDSGPQDFENAYSEVKADALSIGESSAYSDMREKILMVLNNLRAVQDKLMDPDDLEDLSPEERLNVFRSATSSFLSCKSHFESFTDPDWEWFFRMARSNNGILTDRHRKHFQSQFNLVRLSLQNCAKRFGIEVFDLDRESPPKQP